MTHWLEDYYRQTHLLFWDKIDEMTPEVIQSTLTDMSLMWKIYSAVSSTLDSTEPESINENREIEVLKNKLYEKLLDDIEERYHKEDGKILFQVPLSHAADFIPKLIARKTDLSTRLSKLDIEYVIIDPKGIAELASNEDETRRLYNFYLSKIDAADKFIQIVDTADTHATFVEDSRWKKSVTSVASDFQSALNTMWKERQNKLRLYFPTKEMAEIEWMTEKQFYELYIKVTSLDWKRIEEANAELVDLLKEYDTVQVLWDDTDIQFDISGMWARNSVIQTNWPWSEVHTAPLLEWVNGTLSFHNSVYIKMLWLHVPWIRFVFKDGRLEDFQILWDMDNKDYVTEKLEAIFESDDANRYLGELAFWTNFFVPTGLKHPLISEKAFWMHWAFWRSYNYEWVDNGNNIKWWKTPNIHWDVIRDMSDARVILGKKDGTKIEIMTQWKYNSIYLPKLASYQKDITPSHQ